MTEIRDVVLNVDDTESIRYAKTRTLRHAGFEVIEAASGEEALDLVRDRRPALVLLDVNLPGISGLDVCATIKRDFPDVLVLQTSAHFVTSDHRVRGLEGGADAYLTQPVEPAELIATVRALLRIRHAEARLRDSEALMRLTQEAGGVGSWEWDIDTGDLAMSDANYRLIGKAPGTSASFEMFLDAVHPEDRDTVRDRVGRALDDQYPWPISVEYRVLGEDGRTRWLLARAVRLPGPGPKGRLAGVNVDLTGEKEAEARQQILVQELQHRVKNTLSIVQSIARQTLRQPIPGAFTAFEERIANLAKTHDLLTRGDLIGASLVTIVREAIAPFDGGLAGRFDIGGPDLDVGPRMAVALAMALHELGTNASKYGALSTRDGRVSIDWSLRGGAHDRLSLTWRERGGPTVTRPETHGFGSRLIERALVKEFDGTADIRYEPTGVVCELDLAIA